MTSSSAQVATRPLSSGPVRSSENSNWFDVPELAARYTAFFERMFHDGVKPRKPKREPKFKDADSVTATS